ncbi:MAG: hypothetical protein SFV51_29260 [Bryobacteraceae bacterium]|nr:hypothetical protein [Bryobacteraceae bacterium]
MPSLESRLQLSQEIVEAMEARGELALDQLLTRALDRIIGQCELEGLMIASEDGLPVAQSSGVSRGEIPAAIACLCESTVRRAQAEGMVESVEEMTLRGFGGEQIIVRYLPGFDRRFALVAWSKQPCAHRRATMTAIRRCGELLALALEGPPPKRTRKSKARTSQTTGVTQDG